MNREREDFDTPTQQKWPRRLDRLAYPLLREILLTHRIECGHFAFFEEGKCGVSHSGCSAIIV